MSSFALRPARPEDFSQIAAIFNHYIESSLATFRTERVDRAALLDTFYSVVEQRLPYIVAIAFDDPDEPFVLGYAYASRYRPERDAYRHTAELSIYVHPDHLSAGIGTLMLDNVLGLLRQTTKPSLLLGAVAELAPVRQVLVVMALDTEGHKGGFGQRDWYVKRGFVQVGHLREVGYKFGRWVDTIILQLSLNSDTASTIQYIRIITSFAWLDYRRIMLFEARRPVSVLTWKLYLLVYVNFRDADDRGRRVLMCLSRSSHPTTMSFSVRPAVTEDIPAITFIYNHYINHSAATFRTKRVEPSVLLDTYCSAQNSQHPFVVAVSHNGTEILGYAYVSGYRASHPAYWHTVELSIYVHPDHLSGGVGSRLWTALEDALRQRNRALVGDKGDSHSRDERTSPGATPIRHVLSVMALDTEGGGYGLRDWYVKRGFVQKGHLEEVGYKFGRWIDTIILQLTL